MLPFTTKKVVGHLSNFLQTGLAFIQKKQSQWGSSVLLPVARRIESFAFQRECLAGRWEKGKPTRRMRALHHRGICRRCFAHTSGVTFQVVWVYSTAGRLKWNWLRCFSPPPTYFPTFTLFQSPFIHGVLQFITFSVYFVVMTCYETFWAYGNDL